MTIDDTNVKHFEKPDPTLVVVPSDNALSSRR